MIHVPKGNLHPMLRKEKENSETKLLKTGEPLYFHGMKLLELSGHFHLFRGGSTDACEN